MKLALSENEKRMNVVAMKIYAGKETETKCECESERQYTAVG